MKLYGEMNETYTRTEPHPNFDYEKKEFIKNIDKE